MYKEVFYKLWYVQVFGGGKSNDKFWIRIWDWYYDLDWFEWEMFVDFVCFFGEEEELKMNWLIVSWEVFIKYFKFVLLRISLQNLIDKCFIVVKFGGQLSMYNYLCDLGCKIVRDKLVQNISVMVIKDEQSVLWFECQF